MVTQGKISFRRCWKKKIIKISWWEGKISCKNSRRWWRRTHKTKQNDRWRKLSRRIKKKNQITVSPYRRKNSFTKISNRLSKTNSLRKVKSWRRNRRGKTASSLINPRRRNKNAYWIKWAWWAWKITNS